MCGISGIIHKDGTTVNQELIHQMNELIAHRGPDGSGTYFSDVVAFGHRRLSIIDLSDKGAQPMHYGDDLCITYNGEIYNYIELKEELQEKGFEFDSDCDTEVILAAYQKWGVECVRRFNGMWSFAIHDKKNEQIFCSRDRFGIKPFYFYDSDDIFAFGSEIKQLLPHLNARAANEKVLLEYLITGLEDCGDQTFFVAIQKLLPGHNLVYNLVSHKYNIESYYQVNIDEEIRKLDEPKAIEKYRSTLLEAITLRMRSDVKVGTCLSGGLDSSSVAAMSSYIYGENTTEKFNAIHAKSSEKQTDESVFAKMVADHCQLEMHVLEPSEKDFFDNIEEVIYTQEEPFGSPSVFMQYFVMKKARETGCIVMLDGQGGDETLLGYEKYYPAYIKSSKGVTRLKAFVDSSKNSKLSMLDVIKYFIYFTKYKVRMKRLKKKLHFVKASYLSAFQSEYLKTLSDNYLDIIKLQKIEISSTQLPHLLRYEDKNSMRHSVETRLPLIDFRLLETALSLKNDYKIKNGWTKYVLRKSVENLLPAQVVWRKNKLGFNAPEKVWMNGMDDQIMSAIKNSLLLRKYLEMDNLNLATLDLRTKWRLFNVAKWEEVYKVTINE